MHGTSRRTALWTVAAVAMAALCLTFGVAKASAESAASPASVSPVQDKTTLHVGWNQDADTMNPFAYYTLQAFRVFSLNYDYLVRYRARDLQPAPGLATSWSHSADGKTWTFKLRQGVKWQDGKPFTSRDVVFTFNYVIKNNLSNFSLYTTGITEVVALDDYTVEFTCEKPKATMLQMWVPIVPEHVWSEVSPKAASADFQNSPPVIGTGPFQAVEWKHGSFVRMKANPDYWGGGPKVDEVLFEVYTNADTMASDLASGHLQYAAVSSGAFQALGEDPGKTAALAHQSAFDDLNFNCYSGPSGGHAALRDAAFRSALAWAIDTETIAAIAYDGAGIPATGILPSEYYSEDLDYHWQPTAEEAHSYDPAEANSLLDAAGYRDTNGDGVREYKNKPIKLRLWADNTKPEFGSAGKLIAGYLRKVGLQITLQSTDVGVISDGIYATKNGELHPDYDMFVSGWGGDYDPGFLLSLNTTAQINGYSATLWSNAEYDRLYNEQDMTLDPAKRLELVHQMQAIIYRDSPEIPLVYPLGREVYDTGNWTGWVQMPAGTGSVDNPWTYVTVRPATTDAATSSGGSPDVLVAVLVVVAILALVGFWLVRRRRSARREVD